MANLTPKQEKFCQVYIETGNATEAYRQSYNVREGTKESTMNRKAKSLTLESKISARIEELKAAHAERHNMTVDDIIKEQEENRQAALAAKQIGAAVSATANKAKVMGLDKQIIDHQTQGGPMTFTWIKPDAE